MCVLCVQLTYTVLPVWGELKASVADALEASVSVHAPSITTHHTVHDALINI